MKVTAKPARPKKRSRYEAELVAYHEAGHAVAHVLLDVPFRRVTIVPKEGAAGHVLNMRPARICNLWNEGDRDHPALRHYIERELVILLAGPRAQKVRFPRSQRRDYYLAGNGTKLADPEADLTKAQRMADDLFGHRVVGEKYLEFIRERARALIADHWQSVGRVADALLTRHSLTYEDVRRLAWENATGHDLAKHRAQGNTA